MLKLFPTLDKRRIGATSFLMKWKNCGAFIATVSCLNAQTGEAPSPSSQVQADQIRALLEDTNGDLTKLAKGIMGSENTNRFFYFPTRDEPATPAKWGFTYEDVDFASTDGTKLHGWFMPARGKTAKGTIVFSHGNAGSIGHHLGFVMWLVESRYNVFMYDYRGFGKSEGAVDRRGMVEDVESAFDYVTSRPDVDSRKIISYGHSLGGAKSVTALAEKPVKDLKAIIIDGTFASYQAMARIVGGQFGANLITDEFSPKDFIAKITRTPLLVVHGDLDEVVPFSQAKELFGLANEPKTMFEVKGGHHGDSLARDEGAYRKRVLQWLDQLM